MIGQPLSGLDELWGHSPWVKTHGWLTSLRSNSQAIPSGFQRSFRTKLLASPKESVGKQRGHSFYSFLLNRVAYGSLETLRSDRISGLGLVLRPFLCSWPKIPDFCPPPSSSRKRGSRGGRTGKQGGNPGETRNQPQRPGSPEPPPPQNPGLPDPARSPCGRETDTGIRREKVALMC